MNSIEKFDFLKFKTYPSSHINAVCVNWEQYKFIKNKCREDCVTFIDDRNTDYFKVEEDFNGVFWYGVLRNDKVNESTCETDESYEKFKQLHISQHVLYDLIRYAVKNDIFDCEQSQAEICDMFYQMRDDTLEKVNTRYVVEVHDKYVEPTGFDCIKFFENRCGI